MTNKYIAMIIEPRKHRALEFVLRNALQTLPTQWKIIVFHGNKNKSFLEDIIHNQLKEWIERITIVPLNVDNLNSLTYSYLFTKRSIIYDYLEDSEYFLVFQTDSMIFPENIHLLDEFIKGDYDYIGSPWMITTYKPTKDRDYIGNGGFSLRKTKTMLNILEMYDSFKLECLHLEDLFFCTKFDKIEIKKPSYEDAKKFCVGEVYSDVTLACHQPWSSKHFSEFKKIYPESQTLFELQGVFED
jgi:hypothetical protein